MSAIDSFIDSLPLWVSLATFAGIAVATHLVVIALRQLSRRLIVQRDTRRYSKLRSIGTLATSALVFLLYFLALGLILKEFGVSLTAYLASASVIGLAIGFGSQGVVQDVVTGLTFIFSDLVAVGDLVEVSGQTGIVRAITMRFVELENAMGASVFVPNRLINNVINYPRGYVRCIVDVTLRGPDGERDAIESEALRVMASVQQQFPGIMITEPSSEGRIRLPAGKEILRLKFRIWPNREKPIETAFKEELVAAMTPTDPDYKPWMVAISYEVEKRVPRRAEGWLTRRR